MIAKASFMRNDFLAQTIIKCHTLSAIYIISQLNVKKNGKTLEIGRFRRKRAWNKHILKVKNIVTDILE